MLIRNRKSYVYLMVFTTLFALGFVASAGQSTEAAPQRRAARRLKPKIVTANKPRIDYSIFSHQTHVSLKKLACDSCHKFPSKNWKDVRKGEAAFPDIAEFPEHSACLDCHRQQFFARERPAPRICSNCHIKATPRDTTRFIFPSLGDVSDTKSKSRDLVSEFQVSFPHDKHLDVVSLDSSPKSNLPERFVTIFWQEKKEATEAQSCPVCHNTYQPQGDSSEEYVTKPPQNLDDAFWLKKGTFKSIPNSHTTCFSCHNGDLGIAPLPSDCHVCHKLKQEHRVPVADFDPKLSEQMGADLTMLRAWRRRTSSGTYRHEGGDHPNLSCLSCHHVATMNTLEPLTRKVVVKSCGGADGCHITATSDDGGILNYEIDQKKTSGNFVCTKCHITFGKSDVPASHVSVINLLKKP